MGLEVHDGQDDDHKHQDDDDGDDDDKYAFNFYTFDQNQDFRKSLKSAQVGEIQLFLDWADIEEFNLGEKNKKGKKRAHWLLKGTFAKSSIDIDILYYK